jgi:transcriptional regulator with XRE-family HTH domain
MAPGVPVSSRELQECDTAPRLVARSKFKNRKGPEDMPQTGLGAALRKLRERRTLSLREMKSLTDVDHAYVHRLEIGEKLNPSDEMLTRLLRVLKPSERDAAIVRWLGTHPEVDPALVAYVLDDASIGVNVFTMAAGAVHRGTARPDPATLISRAQRILEEE